MIKVALDQAGAMEPRLTSHCRGRWVQGPKPTKLNNGLILLPGFAYIGSAGHPNNNNNNNNNNQAFYSQASWGRLEIKSHEQKKRYKTRAKKGKTKGDQKTKSKMEKRQ
jgi:hypothetical protein